MYFYSASLLKPAIFCFTYYHSVVFSLLTRSIFCMDWSLLRCCRIYTCVYLQCAVGGQIDRISEYLAWELRDMNDAELLCCSWVVVVHYLTVCVLLLRHINSHIMSIDFHAGAAPCSYLMRRRGGRQVRERARFSCRRTDIDRRPWFARCWNWCSFTGR